MRKWIVVMAWMAIASMNAQNVRETIRLDDGWKFAFGNAADPKKDFGCGTEYFNYLTKANSIHNEGPYVANFNDSTWQEVKVPHDWVTILHLFLDIYNQRFCSHASGLPHQHRVGW